MRTLGLAPSGCVILDTASVPWVAMRDARVRSVHDLAEKVQVVGPWVKMGACMRFNGELPILVLNIGTELVQDSGNGLQLVCHVIS